MTIGVENVKNNSQFDAGLVTWQVLSLESLIRSGSDDGCGTESKHEQHVEQCGRRKCLLSWLQHKSYGGPSCSFGEKVL